MGHSRWGPTEPLAVQSYRNAPRAQQGGGKKGAGGLKETRTGPSQRVWQCCRRGRAVVLDSSLAAADRRFASRKYGCARKCVGVGARRVEQRAARTRALRRDRRPAKGGVRAREAMEGGRRTWLRRPQGADPPPSFRYQSRPRAARSWQCLETRRTAAPRDGLAYALSGRSHRARRCRLVAGLGGGRCARSCPVRGRGRRSVVLGWQCVCRGGACLAARILPHAAAARSPGTRSH